ncbi:hypothetical protein ACFCYH_35210 [Streptomyces sp. NPDC056400]|uniref:hypothetical protein n=1 Tax=Streptomyces sp. NPDC056400 TaxID=3345808 RepID=UPI0035D826E1
MPRDLDLGDRLEQLGVNRLAHATIVGVVKGVLPETQVGLLVGSRQWPLLAWIRSATRAVPRTWPVSRPAPPSRTAPPPPRPAGSWTRCAP